MDSAELIARACERHGGRERFAGVESITLDLLDLGGAVPASKGLGKTFEPARRLTVHPHRGRAIYQDYTAPGTFGVYERGRVGLFDDPEATPSGPDHASTRRGFGKLRRWDPLDALYFFGYAITHYLSVPFALADRQPLSHRRRTVWFGFGEGDHTHSPTEGFTFAEDGLLERHDYSASFLGSVFNGAHFSSDYVEFDGLWIARERRVYAKLGHRFGLLTPIPVLRARFEPVEVS